MKELESLTVGQILERAAEQSPDKIGVVDGDRRKTYKEVDTMANALAESLAGGPGAVPQ